MATGRRAFEGKSQASLIAAVLERKPEPISSILPLAPPALSRLVEACIAKDAEERIQTAHDVKLQLQWVAEGGSKAGVPAPVAARRRSRERVAWIVAAAALVAVTALGLLLVMRRAPVEVPVRFIFAAPTGTQGAQWPRVSPDGSQIAFLAADSTGVDRIWVRSIDSYDARPLTGTEGAGRPFWSPDSRFLAYVAEGKLRKVPVAGGPIALIADTFERYDGSWGADGVILLDGRNGDSLLAVPAGGGVPKPATKLDRSLGESQHTWPFFLPDGRHFVFVAEHSGGDRSDAIKLGQLGSLESEVLGTCDSRVEFLAPGHLVFIRGGTLVAQRLDVGRRALVGEPIPITEEVALGRSSGDFSTSASGALAFRPGGAGVSSKLLLLDRTGRELKQIGEERGYRDVSISPDGRRVAVGVAESRSGREDIWVYDVERNTGSRLTFDPGDDIWPVWSADGSRIYFTSNRTGTFRCYSRQAGGVGGVDSLPPSTENMEAVVSCSPDGRWVVTTARGSGSNWDLWVRPADGGEPPRLFLGDPPTERDGVISPDGRWFAYRSDETGRNEIYVRSFPDGASKYQVTKDGGFDPAWASGGRELVYSKDGRIWAVPVTTAGAFQAGTPTPLFEANEMPGGYFERRFDITRDGQRFVINRRQGQTAAREFRVVLNLPEALGLTR